MNTIQIKNLYLNFMKDKGWPVRSSEKLIHSTFPHCFVISGAVDWFNLKIINDPLGDDGYCVCQRAFRHWEHPDKTHLPFFWMTITVPWNFCSRGKVIEDNFEFFENLGLDKDRLQITYWAGGKVFGKGIKLKADVEKNCIGPEFKKLTTQGQYIPCDEEGVMAWKRLGIRDSQLQAVGEIGGINDDRDSILLNAREHFAGVRTEPYYRVGTDKSRWYEIGVFLDEGYIKKTVAKKLDLPPQALADSLGSSNFLVHLKPKIVPGGFGVERLAMAVNGFTSVYQLQPYAEMKIFLISNGATDETLVEQTIAYIPGILWLIKDGAHLLHPKKESQRTGIYRKAVKTVILNLRQLGLDTISVYTQLFKETISFYSQEDVENLNTTLLTALEEVQKQKKRIEIYDRNL